MVQLAVRFMTQFETIMRQGGDAAVQQAARFFMRTDPVHQALRAITGKLNELGIGYAVAGGMALVAHGYDRTTVDVDILVTRDGHRAIVRQLSGLGYVPPFPDSKNLRDTQTGVRIEFIITGDYPGDGKAKPVAFPDPATASIEIDGIRYLRLEKLIELKLASGMSNANRLKDLADVQELIRAIRPPRELGEQLDASVRQKYFEFWDGIASDGESSR